MSSLFIWFTATLFGAAAAAHTPRTKADESPSSSALLQVETSDSIAVFQHSIATWNVRARNRHDQVIRVVGIEGVVPGSSGRADRTEVEPGGEIDLVFETPVHDLLGMQQFPFRVRTARPDEAYQSIVLAAFVESAYLPERPVIHFGSLRRGAASEQVLELRSFETDSLELIDVLDEPSWLRLTMDGVDDDAQTLRLRARLESDAPTGIIRQSIRLRASVPAQSELVATVLATVFEDVVAEPFPLRIGAVNQGAEVIREIRLRSGEEHALRIASIASTGNEFSFSSQACGDGCALVQSRFQPDRIGAVRGNITITFEGPHDPLVIPYEADVVSASTEIIDLGRLEEDADVQIRGRMGRSP